MYVYSIGAALSVTLERPVGSDGPIASPLYQLLATMMASEPSKRPSLQSVVSTSAQYTQGAVNEVNTLVTLVLGSEQHVSSVIVMC